MKFEATLMAYEKGLEIEQEIPYNSRTLMLQAIGTPDARLSVYLPLEQWYAARKVFPKGKDYSMHTEHAGMIRDHAEADAYAEEFYTRELAKLAPPPAMIPVSEPDAQDDTDIPDMPPEAPGTDDIVDEPEGAPPAPLPF